MSHSSGQNLFPRKARIALDFIIIGASLTGLACAYNLICAGHKVRILEQNLAFSKTSFGLKSPPNMTRLLYRWINREKLESVSVKGGALFFILGDNGERISAIVLHEKVIQELQADLRFMNYVDLRMMLYDLLLEAGVEVEFGSKVVEVDPWTPSVKLDTGTIIYGDMIVGADGANGVTRAVVADEVEAEVDGNLPHYSFSIPTSLLQSDKDLACFATDNSWNIFMGNGNGVNTHLVHNGDELSGFIIWPNLSGVAQSAWSRKVPTTAFDFSEYDLKIQKLMKLTPYVVETKQILQPQLSNWYHESGKVVLMGESVHLLTPHVVEGTALCLEDAAIFGSIFSHLQSHDQILYFLSVYQELRQSRCETMAMTETSKTELISLPYGPLQKTRDEEFRMAGGADALDWENVSEEYLREKWEECNKNFAYDAYDEADTWWVEWGYLNEHASAVTESIQQPSSLHAALEVRSDTTERTNLSTIESNLFCMTSNTVNTVIHI